MADRIPLILNTNANQIQEMPSGDTLDLTGSNINGVGILTCSEISARITGDVDIQAGIITATTIDCNGDLDVDGHINFDNLSIAGVSTFSDTVRVGTGVTIESNGQATFVGIVTFGSGSTTIDNNVVNVGTALTLGHTQGVQFHTQNLHSNGFEVNQVNASGIVTATTFSGSGASLTNLNASNIASGTVPTARLGSGTANNTTFLRGDSTFQTVNTDLVSDSSPQLGGHLDCQTYNIDIGDSSGSGSGRLKFGNGDLQIYHDGNNSVLEDSGTGSLIAKASTFHVKSTGGEDILKGITDGAVELYFNNVKKLETSNSGTTFAAGTAVFNGPSGTSYTTEVRPFNSNPYGLGVIENSGANAGYPLLAVTNNSGQTYFRTLSGGVSEARNIQPVANNTYDLGTTSVRWRNIYTNDLNLSNEGGANDVDGTWGNYTIQEGESDLFLINKRSGKKYKFNLTEVS